MAHWFADAFLGRHRRVHEFLPSMSAIPNFVAVTRAQVVVDDRGSPRSGRKASAPPLFCG
jgi:hypothetical protein